MGGWCKFWFNSRSLNSFFNWTIFFPLYAELQIFLKFVKIQWGGGRRGHNFHNVNDRKKLSVVNIYIVTVCVFVCHMFSYHPFYSDFHSVRIIFDVSSGFYFWNVNRTPT